jgi:hypothetical protein
VAQSQGRPAALAPSPEPLVSDLPSPTAQPVATGSGRDHVTPQAVESVADFVCEEDVRQAIRKGRKIVIGERSIITPAARDLGEEHRLFVQATWPR